VDRAVGELHRCVLRDSYVVNSVCSIRVPFGELRKTGSQSEPRTLSRDSFCG
jgi:hypothetical protein